MYERVDYLNPDRKPDCGIVFPPSLTQRRLVLAYWHEFRAALDELPCQHWHDRVLFSRYRLLYEKLAQLLHPAIPVESLMPSSRHAFYVSKGSLEVGESKRLVRLSGIQRLLGYKEEAAPEPDSPGLGVVGTGQDDLDVISSLVQLRVGNLEWLCSNYSLSDLASIAEYLWEMRAAALGRTTEAQRRRDYELYEQVRSQQAALLDAGEQEAQNFLLNRTGPQAIQLAEMILNGDG